MSGYAKLFTRILDSTIWRENNPTRILWITMLALADRDGIVHCTIPGLADRAKISLEECEYALSRFQNPDKYSWSKEEEGRRITVVEDGWFLVNHAKFRALMSAEETREKTRIRTAKWREKKRHDTSHIVTPVTSDARDDIAEAYTKPPLPPFEKGGHVTKSKPKKKPVCERHPESGVTQWGSCWTCYEEKYGTRP